jgi:hypothetical protein
MEPILGAGYKVETVTNPGDFSCCVSLILVGQKSFLRSPAHRQQANDVNAGDGKNFVQPTDVSNAAQRYASAP